MCGSPQPPPGRGLHLAEGSMHLHSAAGLQGGSDGVAIGGPQPSRAEARSFGKHACPAGFSPSNASHAVRQPAAAPGRRAATRPRARCRLRSAADLQGGSDGAAIGGPSTAASGRADSTSQTSAGRSFAPRRPASRVRSLRDLRKLRPVQRIARMCGRPQLRPAKARNSCECVRFASCAPSAEASGEGKIPHRTHCTAPKALPLPSSKPPPAA